MDILDAFLRLVAAVLGLVVAAALVGGALILFGLNCAKGGR